MRVFRPIHIAILCTLICLSFRATAQHDRPYNRFQYHTYQWQSLHTGAFHIYFPKGYDSLCVFIARRYIGTVALIKKRMGSGLQQEPNIIIYPSADQLYETNIGGFDPKQYTLPTIVLKGDRIVLAYTGSYEALQEQLQAGIVRAVWEKQFSEGLDDQVQATVAGQQLPYWFTEGAMRYFAKGWSIADEDAFRNSFTTQHFSSWDAVIAWEPALAGQALCYFLSQQYYPTATMQLYMQLRKKKSLPRALRLITKKNAGALYAQCYDFYKARFTELSAVMPPANDHLTIPHEKGVVKQVLANEYGQVAYITASFHKRTLWVYDLNLRRAKRILSYALPPWVQDHRADPYPLVAWQDAPVQLLAVVPEKGKLHLKQFDANGNTVQDNIFYGTDGIIDITAMGGHEQLLAAFRKGQSDIVRYNDRKEKYTALTDDAADDHAPVLNPSDGSLYFLSQRQMHNPEIPTRDSVYEAHGIFKQEHQQLSPVATDTLTYRQWGKLWVLPDGRLLTTTTGNGFRQFAFVDKNGHETALYACGNFSYAGDRVQDYTADADSIYLRSYPVASWSVNGAAPTVAPWLRDYRRNEAEHKKEDSILNAARSTEPSFLDGVLKPKSDKERAAFIKDSAKQSLQYDPKRIRPYVLQLHSAYFTARVNNDYLINRYQPYFNYQGQFKFPEAGGMADGGFTDLFENHHFGIMYRLPAGSEGSDFRVRYKNTKQTTDWGLAWFRKVESLKPDPARNWLDESGHPYPNAAKVKTNHVELFIHRPISYYFAADLSTAVRHDRTVFLATDLYPLTYKDLISTWSISNVSFTLNKLQPTLSALYKGFKGSVSGDFFKGFNQQKATLYAAGMHLEYHQPVYRYITVVGNVQTGYSGGDASVLYNMGGVDNNLSIRTDTTVHFSQSAPYAFQTLVTPLRGYWQNSIYGNQYLLLNLDVYFPLFETLIPLETPLPSVNQLQLGLFTDIAEAKETWRGNATANWKTAIGFGARTYLAGYPLRFDMGFPGWFSEKPVWYLSLSVK